MRERSSVSRSPRNEIFDLVIFAYSTKTRPRNLPASYASKSTDATIACEMSAHEGERTRDLHLLPDKARSIEFSVVEERTNNARIMHRVRVLPYLFPSGGSPISSITG